MWIIHVVIGHYVRIRSQNQCEVFSSTVTLPKAVKLLSSFLCHCIYICVCVTILFIDSPPFQISPCLPSLVHFIKNRGRTDVLHWRLCDPHSIPKRPHPDVLHHRAGVASQPNWNCLQSLMSHIRISVTIWL